MTVTSINPNQANGGQTLNIILAGTNFTGATTVNFGSGMTVNNFAVNSAIQITANISISNRASNGPGNVSVTTPGETGTLANGFTIIR